MCVAVVTALSPIAGAQVLDQVQELDPYSFNGDATWAQWQQEITVGIAGQLAGVEIKAHEEGGAPVGDAFFYINVGSPWQSDPNEYEETIDPPGPGWLYIDVSSSNIMLDVGDTFCIGITGINANFWFLGSAPSPGGPYAGGALYFEGSIYQGGQYDMAFRTYMFVTAPCPADVNGDGSVDVLDLLQLLAAWGNSGGPEDINGDGIVDVLDLLALLSAWGPC
jgi:hypothetical protein